MYGIFSKLGLLRIRAPAAPLASSTLARTPSSAEGLGDVAGVGVRGRRARRGTRTCSGRDATSACSHGVVLEQDRHEALDRTEPKRARWIMIGSVRELSRMRRNSASNRWGVWKSSWTVDIWCVRPMASRACTEILGP